MTLKYHSFNNSYLVLTHISSSQDDIILRNMFYFITSGIKHTMEKTVSGRVGLPQPLPDAEYSCV